MRFAIIAAAVVCFGALWGGSASAITFGTIDLESGDQADLADGLLDEGDQAVSGPLTLTFFNIITSDGFPGAQVDQDGIFFGRDPVDFAVVTMDMTFSTHTILTAYDIDFFFTDGDDPEDAFFQILGPNGTSTGMMDFFPDEDAPARIPFDMGDIGVFSPDEVYTFTHTITGFDVSQIDEFDFAAVPLPPAALLLLTGLAGLGFLRQRRA